MLSPFVPKQLCQGLRRNHILIVKAPALDEVALDALLQKRPRLCALKIDVEGSEDRV